MENKELTEIIIQLFKKFYCGHERAVKTDRIIFDFAALGIAVEGRDIRKLLGQIRQRDLLAPQYILSDVKAGYWLSESEQEMSSWLDKQMNRMSNQFGNIKALHQRIRYAKKDNQNIQIQLF